MLTPEQAQAFVEANILDYKIVIKQQLNTISQLPKKLRPIAYALIERDENGELISSYHRNVTEYHKKRDQLEQALEQLDDLAGEDRQRIFAVYLPKIAKELEDAWQLQKKTSYQISHIRKAFRAPNHPQATLSKRINWVKMLIQRLTLFDEDIVWLAQYVPYLNHGIAAWFMGPIFAAAINAGDVVGTQVYDILVASARGDHEVGRMGRHIPSALLSASRPEGWEFMQKFLLAAQRQEGLRQKILETVDEAHPDAFKRMLHVIIDNNLVRFSAVARAANVWLGFAHDSANARGLKDLLTTLLGLLESHKLRQKAIERGDGEAVYLALWAVAVEDAYSAIPLAAELLHDKQIERRFAALHLLATLDLPEAYSVMILALEDDDLRLAAYTCQALWHSHSLDEQMYDGLFEKIEAFIERLPQKPRVLESLIWPWITIEANGEMAAGLLLNFLHERSPKRLIPYMSAFSKYDRMRAARILARSSMGDPEVRDTILKLVGDRAQWIRSTAIEIMAEQTIEADDAVYLEGLLIRRANDLRQGIIRLLIKQPDEQALSSADRLIESAHPLQRQAGLETLQLLAESERSQSECQQRAIVYRQTYSECSDIEQALIQRILAEEGEDVSLENALGLMDPVERTAPITPQDRRITLMTKASEKCLVKLDDLIHENRQTPIILTTWQGQQEVLLGNLMHGLPKPDTSKSVEDDLERWPLREMWQNWYESRDKHFRDADGLELIRAWVDCSNGYRSNLSESKPKRIRLRYGQLIESILTWFVRLYEPSGAADFLLDTLEHTYVNISYEVLETLNDPQGREDWRFGWNSPYPAKLQLVRQFRLLSNKWQPEHDVRLWQLLHWLDQPTPEAGRFRPELQELLRAYDTGAATKADIYDQLLGERTRSPYGGGQFNDIRMLSTRKPHPLLTDYPALQQIFEACRRRILEVELLRGELPTAASSAALALRSAHGIEWYVKIAAAFGKDSLSRGYAYHSQSRSTVLSHVLRVTFPLEDETVEQFVAAVKRERISQKRLVETAVYAPQWAGFVEAALGWDQFSDAVWWIHAHTKDRNWYVDQDIRAAWQFEVSERTSLSGEDLLAGAVDVQWFWRLYRTLGKERWAKIYAAAKYSSGGSGHTRSKLFADAMLGNVSVEDVSRRITQKRHQDSVRALGLIPIDAKDHDAQILARYQVIQEFLRKSRKFGAQRQQSEKLAARIGLENLARTAGYPDPLRLQWAMEAREVADLRDGEVIVTKGSVTVALRIDEVGKPHLRIEKDGKKLKNIPAKLRKNEDFVVLRERKKTIEQQHSRMRHSLEAAMCRKDMFKAAELRELAKHAVLAPLLEQLVFVADDNNIMGYPIDGASALMQHDGLAQSLTIDTELRIAHPYDLYQTGEWSSWQHECFVSERIQPFKQVFRELYVLTDAEKRDGAISRRYAGHQVQPRQAIALLGSRGWVSRPEEGVQRTFHEHKLVAFVTYLNGFYTPAQVEGLTVEGVIFRELGKWKPLSLKEIPPIVFSEVMRDMDLVVSVAHRGGVDPEATASTVEMRTALLRETCQLLKVQNVELSGTHALVEGKLGSYSVHLGSAIVHRQPGGALCIVPIHAQHRGRIYLPFADDDPKTAEVISKVLLLAQDDQIKDPVILDQIFAGG